MGLVLVHHQAAEVIILTPILVDKVSNKISHLLDWLQHSRPKPRRAENEQSCLFVACTLHPQPRSPSLQRCQSPKSPGRLFATPTKSAVGHCTPHFGIPIPSLRTESKVPQLAAFVNIITLPSPDPHCKARNGSAGEDRADQGLFRCCRASSCSEHDFTETITRGSGLYGLEFELTAHWHFKP